LGFDSGAFPGGAVLTGLAADFFCAAIALSGAVLGVLFAVAAFGEVCGTLRAAPHLGHFPLFPAIASGTERLAPHWHVTRIGIVKIAEVFAGNEQIYHYSQW